MSMGKRVAALMLVFIMLLGVVGCSGNGTEEESEISYTDEGVAYVTGEIFAMDTYMTLSCYGDNCQKALDAALAEIERLDNLLSVGNENSEIAKINNSGSGTLSEDSITMVEKSLEVYEKTGGAFDITVYPLMVEWGFTSGDFKVPDQDTIDTLLKNMGSDKLSFDASTGDITLGEGQGIDLGGIAKGYTSDRIMEIFAEYDLVAGLVSLGGNVETYKTRTDGKDWRCGIQNPTDPDNESGYLGILEVSDKAVITSGAYERNFTDEATGKTYHHIIDPKTGYSANNGLISVTVISDEGIEGDALSTSCYIMGLEQSVAYWQQYGDEDHFDLVMMTDDGDVYVTAGIADKFTSDYDVHVVERET